MDEPEITTLKLVAVPNLTLTLRVHDWYEHWLGIVNLKPLVDVKFNCWSRIP